MKTQTLTSDFYEQRTEQILVAVLQTGSGLTGVGHGEAAAGIHHVHLRHQLGDVLMLRQSEAKHLVLVRAGGEKASC